VTRTDAIRASIAHWRKALRSPETESLSASSCPLCQIYIDPVEVPPYNTSSPPCLGCPVQERTGQTLCRGTPYIRASGARFRLLLKRWPAAGPEREEWERAAREQIEFLESLLEGEQE
jgi:hypothetical protein